MARPHPLLVLVITLAAATSAQNARAAAAPDPPPEAVLAELPFRPSDEVNRVLVDLAPKGADPLVLMLDTGASDSVVTPRIARSIGVTVRRGKRSPYRRATLLGRDLQFWIDTESSDTASKTGWDFGLLGGEFLDEYVVEIDFPARKVRFLDPKRYTVPEHADAPDEAVVVPKIVAHRILVPVEVNGKSLEVMLDTGAPDTLILSGNAARQLDIEVDALAPFGTGGSVLGPMELRFYEAAEFRFAGLRSAPFPVIVAPKGWYNLVGPNDSVIGYDVLRPFVLRIDYPRKRLWLRRTGDPRVTLLGADYEVSKRIGALLTPFRGVLAVQHVTPGGAAAQYGLREGDAIVAPAGEKLPSLDAIVAKINAREELTVARRQEGDVYVDTVLPEAPATEP